MKIKLLLPMIMILFCLNLLVAKKKVQEGSSLETIKYIETVKPGEVDETLLSEIRNIS